MVAAAVVVAVVLAVALWPRQSTTTMPAPAPTSVSAGPSASPSASPTPSLSPATSPSPGPTARPSALPRPSARPTDVRSQPCTTPTEAFRPTSYTLERVDAHERVIPMHVQGGNVPSPPKRDRRSAGWWQDGPAPGAGRGKVVLTIHTYRPGLRPALGNELYAGGHSALRPGDLLKMHGADGQIACYEYVEAPRIKVSDYDPDSGVMIDRGGPASAVIVICWDHRNGNWDSRVMFQFRAVTG